MFHHIYLVSNILIPWYLGQSYFIIFNRFNCPFHWSPMFQHRGKISWAPTLNHPRFTYQKWVCKKKSQMVNAMALRVPYHVLFHQHAPWNIGYSEHPVNYGFSMLLVIPNILTSLHQAINRYFWWLAASWARRDVCCATFWVSYVLIEKNEPFDVADTLNSSIS